MLWGYEEIMEKNMETIVIGLYRDNGKEHGNHYSWVILSPNNGESNEKQIENEMERGV